ncbi:MAG: carbamoyltransferase family protein [Halobacteriota archaeon]
MNGNNTSGSDISILGISAFYHDSASALIRNGNIVAASQEERFSRAKNDSNFPSWAINYCLEEGRIDVSDLSAIVFYDNPYRTLERIISSHLAVAPEGAELWKNAIEESLRTKLRIPEIIRHDLNYAGDICFVEHHVSHAASAFFASPFEEAAILTIDGVGEWATSCICCGQGNEIEILKQLEYPDSLGLLYSAFTYFCGFKVNEGEYKLMGLAPYGSPRYVDTIKDNLLDVKDDGSIKLNMKFFGYTKDLSMITDDFSELFGGSPRNRDSSITQREIDIARSVQAVTEEVVLKMARHAYDTVGSKYLCLAGGVALNCVANGRLLREGNFEDIWIQPAAGDAGGALGAALYLYYTLFGGKRQPNDHGKSIQGGSYFGPCYSNDEVQSCLDAYGLTYERIDREKRSQVLAQCLADGKVVGHFSGRMEFGPRALGSRSILADARDATMQSRLNLKIKFRESFRPFAPTVLLEDAGEYFESSHESPYMLLVTKVRQNRCLCPHDETDIIQRVNQKRSDIPAVTHVDYSARIQTIDRHDHPDYYDIIKQFRELTGYGVVVNTSFNVRDEPIVCQPYDAVRCFMNTDMDILAIEDYILYKGDQDPLVLKEDDMDTYLSRDNVALTHDKKLRKSAQKLFSKQLLKVKQEIGKLPIDLSFGHNSTQSNWRDNLNKQYHWLFNFGTPNIGTEVEFTLSFWDHYNSHDRELFKPMLKNLVELKRSASMDRAMIRGSTSEEMYTMF